MCHLYLVFNVSLVLKFSLYRGLLFSFVRFTLKWSSYRRLLGWDSFYDFFLSIFIMVGRKATDFRVLISYPVT